MSKSNKKNHTQNSNKKGKKYTVRLFTSFDRTSTLH